MDWRLAAAVLFAAWTLQAVLAFRQASHYRQTLREVAGGRRSGYLGVGTAARRIGRGAVVMLVAAPDGTIEEGRKMVGATVFARFEPYDRLNGLHVDAALAALPGGGARRTALEEAAAGALAQIRERMRKAGEADGAAGSGTPHGGRDREPGRPGPARTGPAEADAG